MDEMKNVTVLKIALILTVIINFVYGIGYLLFPQTLVSLAGELPFSTGWLRWSGGVLLALSAGAVLAYINVEHQGPIVIMYALASLFCGLALVYHLIFELEGDYWFTLVPALITLVESTLLWIGYYFARDVLKNPLKKV